VSSKPSRKSSLPLVFVAQLIMVRYISLSLRHLMWLSRLLELMNRTRDFQDLSPLHHNVDTSIRPDNSCFLFLDIMGVEIACSELNVYVFAVDAYS